MIFPASVSLSSNFKTWIIELLSAPFKGAFRVSWHLATSFTAWAAACKESRGRFNVLLAFGLSRRPNAR